MPAHDASDIDQTSLLSEVTLAALQIPQQPFGPAAPDAEIHADDTSVEQLADVRHALVSGDDLLLILGDAGAGKTTLLDQLGLNSGQNIQCFAVRGSPRFSTMNLFAGMLEAFKRSPPEQLKDVLDELIPCLQTMVARNTLSAIILDDADQISEEELTQLLSGMLYINGQDDTLMRVALAAPPDFEDRIPDLLPEGADLPYSSLSIEGMDTERTAAFIDFHLRQAGYDGELPLTDDDLAQIVSDSGGLPGAIKPAAASLLNQLYDPEAHPAPVAPPAGGQAGAFLQSRNGKLVLGAVAVVLILTGLLMFGGDSPEHELAPRESAGETNPLETRALGGDSEQDPSSLTQDSGETASDALDTASQTNSDATDGSTTDEVRIVEERRVEPFRSDAIESLVPEIPIPRSSGSAESANGQAAAESATGTAAADTVAAGTEGSANAGTSVADASTAANSPPVQSDSASIDRDIATTDSPEETTSNATEAGQSGQANATATADGALPNAADVDNSTGSTDTAATASNATANADANAGAVPDTNSNANADPDVDPELVDILESPTWILVQDANLTTVQMSASRDRPSIESFLKRNRDALPPPNSIYTFQRNGETWYALLHGLYANFEEAQRAVQAMPDAAVTDQPWIRNVGRVQDILKAQ